MSQAPSMPMFWGDYFGDTRHLTTEQHGAYLLMLGTMWMTTGASLPDDDVGLAKIAGVTPARWRKKLRAVMEPFFVVADGVWRHRRINKEREFIAKRRASFAERGKLGGRPKSLKSNETAKAIGYPQLKLQESTQAQAYKKKEKHVLTDVPKESPPAETTTPMKEPSDARKRGSRLAADWEPSDADVAFAITAGFDLLAIDRIGASFRDYWLARAGSGGVKLDWAATWRNWVRRAGGSRPVGRPAGNLAAEFLRASAAMDARMGRTRDVAGERAGGGLGDGPPTIDGELFPDGVDGGGGEGVGKAGCSDQAPDGGPGQRGNGGLGVSGGCSGVAGDGRSGGNQGVAVGTGRPMVAGLGGTPGGNPPKAGAEDSIVGGRDDGDREDIPF